MSRFKVPFILAAFVLACNALLPTEEPPGVGEKAEKGYAASAPVIAALEAYKADHGSYPEKLDQLVPDYLPSVPVKTDELDFSYSSDGATYSFSFHYIGPGMNTCAYSSEGKEWNCSGAY
ncbi:MAG: hypothetical protein KPEEDBHJ_03554 [Anaerolineales bacterium]|nr:hypothetical protein [Anaerolineales bacterium]